ncbi:MAG: hypothetical protein DRJ42_12070 [Deltaproteobacteria bacterium]|nr:MAG: hypothetical protein DRJ42_12070 [Deltaproteobacteria bacterium]
MGGHIPDRPLRPRNVKKPGNQALGRLSKGCSGTKATDSSEERRALARIIDTSMNDPFARLGISPTNDARLIRGAFRRKAALLHPDRHGNTRGASERFKGIVRAYEAALREARSGPFRRNRGTENASASVPEPASPPAPIRERYACPRCDDTFPVADTCPRCTDEVVDTWGGARRSVPEDPRIAELIARLEAGPRFEIPELPIADAARPWVGAAAFVTAGWATTGIGLIALGAMLAAFGLSVAALAAHDQLTQGAKVRLFLF